MLQRRKAMTDSAQPFAAKKFLEIKGRRMAYIAEGVQGIAYMEAPVQPMIWADFPEDVRSLVQGSRSKDGETMVLEKNLIVENVLPGAILRRLSEDEMAAYRAPFANAG